MAPTPAHLVSRRVQGARSADSRKWSANDSMNGANKYLTARHCREVPVMLKVAHKLSFDPKMAPPTVTTVAPRTYYEAVREYRSDPIITKIVVPSPITSGESGFPKTRVHLPDSLQKRILANTAAGFAAAGRPTHAWQASSTTSSFPNNTHPGHSGTVPAAGGSAFAPSVSAPAGLTGFFSGPGAGSAAAKYYPNNRPLAAAPQYAAPSRTTVTGAKFEK